MFGGVNLCSSSASPASLARAPRTPMVGVVRGGVRYVGLGIDFRHTPRKFPEIISGGAIANFREISGKLYLFTVTAEARAAVTVSRSRHCPVFAVRRACDPLILTKPS